MRSKPGKWDPDSVPEGLAFFAYAMDELLNMGTLLPYRAPLMSTRALALEALATVNDIREGLCRKANLETLLDEMDYRLREDVAARAILGGGKASGIADDFRKNNLDLTENEVRFRVIAAALRRRYVPELKSQLRAAIDEGREKSRILTLTEMLVAELASAGICSHAYLYRVTREHFFDESCAPEKIGSIEDLDRFFALLERDRSDWEVYVAVSNLFEQCFGFVEKWAKRNELQAVLWKKQDFKAPDREVGERLAAKTYKNILVLSGITSRTPEGARSKAAEFLLEVTRLYSFEFHGKSLAWDAGFEVWDLGSKSGRKIGPPPTPMKSPIERSPVVALTRLEEVAEGVGVTPFALHQYSRVVELHNMAQRDRGSGNQLLDLWAILESIVPTLDKETATINHVCNTLAPLVQYRHFCDVIACALRELLAWDRVKTIGVLDLVDQGSRLRSLAALLAVDEYGDSYEQLLVDLSPHPLLKHRIKRLHEVLSSPKMIERDLDLAERRTAWDLHRMYRNRNGFVHAAEVIPELARHLVGRLHQYVDLLIQLLMELVCLQDGVDDFHSAMTEADLSVRMQSLALVENRKTGLTVGNYISLLFPEGSVILREADALHMD